MAKSFTFHRKKAFLAFAGWVDCPGIHVCSMNMRTTSKRIHSVLKMNDVYDQYLKGGGGGVTGDYAPFLRINIGCDAGSEFIDLRWAPLTAD